MPTVASIVFKVITRIEHTSPSADELCRFLEALFILRHPKLLSPSHSIRPLTTSGSGKVRPCLDLVSLSDCFSNLSIAVRQTQPAEIRSESRKTQRSIFSPQCQMRLKQRVKLAGPDAHADHESVTVRNGGNRRNKRWSANRCELSQRSPCWDPRPAPDSFSLM
jgi:hypothetical protein